MERILETEDGPIKVFVTEDSMEIYEKFYEKAKFPPYLKEMSYRAIFDFEHNPLDLKVDPRTIQVWHQEFLYLTPNFGINYPTTRRNLTRFFDILWFRSDYIDDHLIELSYTKITDLYFSIYSTKKFLKVLESYDMIQITNKNNMGLTIKLNSENLENLICKIVK